MKSRTRIKHCSAYTFTKGHTRTHTQAHTRTRMHIHEHTQMHTHVQEHAITYTHAYTHTHSHAHTHAHTQTYTHARTRTHTHTHPHANHTHTHTHARRVAFQSECQQEMYILYLKIRLCWFVVISFANCFDDFASLDMFTSKWKMKGTNHFAGKE